MLFRDVCKAQPGKVYAGGTPCFYNPMAAHFGLVVPEGGPLRATSIVADEGERTRVYGDWRKTLEDLWRAGRDAVVGKAGEIARGTPAGQQVEQRATREKVGELLLGPVGAIAGLVLLVLLARR